MSSTVGIVRTDGVLAGKPRIEGTRIPVHQIGVCVRGLEWTQDEVTDAFGLDERQIQAALEYYDDHPAEMERLLASRAATFEAIRAQSDAPQ